MADYPLGGPEVGDVITSTGPQATSCVVDLIHGTDTGEGLLIRPDGSLRTIIRLKGMNAQLLDAKTRERMSLDFAALAASLNTDIQIVVTTQKLPVEQFLSKHHTSALSNLEYLRWYGDYTEKWFHRVCETQMVPQRDFYLVMSYLPPPGPSVQQEWNGTQVHLPAGSLEELSRHSKRACEFLTLCNLHPSILAGGELRTLMERQPGLPLQAKNLQGLMDEQTHAVELENENLQLNERLFAVQYLKQLPSTLWIGWLGELLTIGIEHTLSLFLHPHKQELTEQELQIPIILEAADQVHIAFASNSYPINNELKPIPNKYLDITLCVYTEADKLELLKQRMNSVDEVFSTVGAVMAQDSLQTGEPWQSSLPLALDKPSMSHKVSARAIGTFWPFHTARCGTTNGIIFGFAAPSGEPVMFDPFSRGDGKNNNNILIAGAVGSWRSFAMTMFTLRMLPGGGRFILLSDTISRFSSYEFITEILGPDSCANISLADGSENVLNPFDREIEEHSNEPPSSRTVSKLLSFFDLILAPDGQDELLVQEKALLDRLIRMAYAESAARATIPTLSEFTRLIERKASEESNTVQRDLLQNLACGLSIFTQPGAYSSFLDGLTNIDTDKKFVVFDTKGLAGQRYERAATFILSDFLERQARKSKITGERLAVLVDQSQGLMGSEAGMGMLDKLSCSARQYGMLFVVNTHRLNSCSAAGLGGPLLRNAQTKIFLQTDSDDLSPIKQELRITDVQVQAIANLKRDRDSRCMLIVGDNAGIVKFTPSPMDYWICTSEPIMDIPKRRSRIELIKSTNPEITHTDACRQAVYFLSSEMDP